MKKLLLTSLFILLTKFVFCQCSASASWTTGNGSPTLYLRGGASGTSGWVHYSWDFGDGSPNDTMMNTVHTYLVYGAYNVCLTISDSVGCIDTTCYLISFPPPSLVVYDLIIDTTVLNNCIAPSTVDYMYNVGANYYLSTDSFLFDLNFGDGTDSLFYVNFNNTPGGFVSHTYQNPGRYTARLIVTAPDLQTDTGYSAPVIISSTCGSVSGTVYNDLNGNCIDDPGEELQYIGISIYSSGSYIGWTSSDSLGQYSFNVPTGSTYEVYVNSTGGLTGHFTPVCPASGMISISSIPSTGNDFGVACPQGFDLQGSVMAWGLRPGFNGGVCVQVYNQFCNTPTGQFDIIFPPELTILPDTTGAGSYTIHGDTLTYAIGSPDLEWSFCVPVLVDQQANIGDTVCIRMNIEPVAGDSLPGNNNGTFCFVIRGSYDPNDKCAVPAGDGPQGFIRPNTPLTYTIRFQNTGNAEALNIYILDTLSTYLDPASVEVIGSSHDMHWSLLSGNILRFNFDNVNLADSTANEAMSHGYVTYRVRPLNVIPQMAQITNTAAIYFDFNSPVMTNTTLHTVDQFLGVNAISEHSSVLIGYPNPANQQCSLHFTNNDLKKISVTNVLGKEVFAVSTESESYLLNTGKFAEGIYMITVSGNRTTITGKLIINH